MQHGFSQRRIISAVSITRRGMILSSLMATTGCVTRGLSNLDYSRSEMSFNKLDTAIAVATIDGQQLITLPFEFNLEVLSQATYSVGTYQFQGVQLLLDTTAIRTPLNFGLLKSIAVTLDCAITQDVKMPPRIWIVNDQTQQVLILTPTNAVAGAVTLTQTFDVVPSQNSKLRLVCELTDANDTPVHGFINLNNFHLFV